MANSLFSWLIAIAAVYPVGLTLMNIGYKPVDVVLSDLLFVVILLSPRRGLLRIPDGIDLRLLAMVRVSAVVLIGYCLSTALIGYALSSDTSRLLSATKFFKPIAFVPLGFYMASLFPPFLLLRRIAIAFAAIMLLTMGTTILTPGFPRCDWGRYFLSEGGYGYRNCLMTFNGVLVPLLIAVGDSSRRWYVRRLFFISAMITALIVLFAMARSSIIAMVAAVVIYYLSTSRWHVPAVAAGIAGLLAIAGVGLLQSENEVIVELRSRIETRYLQTVEGDDALSGRTDIWWYTIELAADRPMFGYLFEPYSNYSPTYDTPHQQYLEVLYKTGIVGSMMYAWLLGGAVLGLLHLKRFAVRRSEADYLLAAVVSALLATLIGNLSQPNLTYSLLGNLLFLFLGLVLNRHAAAGLLPTPLAATPALSAADRLPALSIAAHRLPPGPTTTMAADSP